jgi:16S rRNA (guanine966-N2)-methyltransferase
VGLAGGGWLAPGALVVFERGADEPDLEAPGYEVLDQRKYGVAKVWFLAAAK